MLSEHALGNSGVPNCVQIREIILFLRISHARFFILKLHWDAVPTFIAVGFIVQWLMNVAHKMNEKTQSIGTGFGIAAGLELLRVLRDCIHDAALLACLADLVFVARSVQGNVDVMQRTCIRLVRAHVVGPACNFNHRRQTRTAAEVMECGGHGARSQD